MVAVDVMHRDSGGATGENFVGLCEPVAAAVKHHDGQPGGPP